MYNIQVTHPFISALFILSKVVQDETFQVYIFLVILVVGKIL